MGFLAGLILSSNLANAQYTTDFQTNIISGVTSNWTGDYAVGSATFSDTLIIQNGGVLTNLYAYVGLGAATSNNTALVTGPGSVWVCQYGELVGDYSPGNSLAISCEVGVEKPDAEIFLTALRAAGVSAADAIHVGDCYEEDVRGAEAVGMRAVLVDRNPEASSGIRDLREIWTELDRA